MHRILNCEIQGYGWHLPKQTVQFGDQIRYRIGSGESQLDMLTQASIRAMTRAEIEPSEIDLIIGASAAGVQPLPTTAALLQERIAPDAKAGAMDVSSTCTSFITALGVAAMYIHTGQKEKILVASGDVGTRFLNPKQQESFELFSDAAAAFVISKTEDISKGVLASAKQTWPAHAHDTEVRGGLSAIPPEQYAERPEDYLFDMNGPRALIGMIRKLPPFFADFWKESGLTIDDIQLVIPHQASRALGAVMNHLDIPQEKYADYVQTHGNMVSASIPFVLSQKLADQTLQSGDTALLCGTAAGLTADILAIRL